MSRSGCSDDCDDLWGFIRWRGAVTSAIRGRKGQAFLRELLAALDELPEKQLIADSFQAGAGVCTLGAVCQQRGVAAPVSNPDDWDDFDARSFARQALSIPDALAAEIMYLNDEGGWGNETPYRRWERMRTWIVEHIAGDQP